MSHEVRPDDAGSLEWSTSATLLRVHVRRPPRSDEVAALSRELLALPRDPHRRYLICTGPGLAVAGPDILGLLARLGLDARRMGLQFWIPVIPPRLAAVLNWTGLDEVFGTP